MIHQYARKETQGFDWIDLLSPTEEEIRQVAAQYNLHEASIKDCMQPEHLPKYESFDDYDFFIFRVLSKNPGHEADTILELTNKIAIFCIDHHVITIHRSDLPMIDLVKTKCIDNGRCRDSRGLLTSLIREAMLTFEQPGIKLSESLDHYEERVFLRQRNSPILRGLYFVKRKIDVIRRLLLLSYEIIDNIDTAENSNAHTRDLRDLYIRTRTLFDNLSENTAQLLAVYFSLASQRTNEIMRVLTVFSVFFMPLTFVVGVYGMNFKYMPELEWYYGYPAVVLLMLCISAAVFFWFKKKGWW